MSLAFSIAQPAAYVRADCYATALARAAGAPVIAGESGWLFLASELRFLTSGDFWGEAAIGTGRAVNPAHRDPLEPIDDFNRQLLAMGIRLLVVPVPPKALIYPAQLGCSRDDAQPALRRLRRFYELLRERGVEVLDLTEDFLKPQTLAEGPLYCKSDSHWSGVGLRRAALQIANWIQANDLLKEAGNVPTWGVRARESRIVGDLTRLLRSSETESVELFFVEDDAGNSPRADATSPILLLGDSHVLVFHEGADLHAVGAGLPEHLALLLGTRVDVLGVRGSGATTSRISLIRRIKGASDFQQTKKAIVWCFAAREFTEADAWRFVPLPIQ
jgi:alginate O-acetyltransferase complex protein AlgJ